MPNILYPPSRPQSLGEVLDLAFRIFRASMLKTLPLAVLALIAGQVPNIYYMLRGGLQAMTLAAYTLPWWILYALGYVAGVTMWSMILLRQHALATGRPMPNSTAFAAVVERLPALIGVWLLIAALVLAPLLPSLLFSPPARYVVFVLLLIPASYVAVELSCAWSALLVTGRGPVASIAYSWRLTSGSFWRLCTIYTVALFLLMVLYLISGVIGAVIALPLAHGDLAVISAVGTVMVVIVGAIGTPYYSALALTVLGDLAVRKEGADLAQRMSAAAVP